MMNKKWRLIRVLNEELLNIPPQVSDYLAVESVLRSSATGMSVESISKVEELPVKIIKQILMEFYKVAWTQDLDINTLLVFTRVKGNYKKFLKEIKNISSVISNEDIVKSFYVCSIYTRIKKEIDKYYA